MQDRLLARELGSLSPRGFAKTITTDLLSSFTLAPQHRFDGTGGGNGSSRRKHDTSIVAHESGANALAIEKFDGRWMVSGGSDGSVKIWDLETCGNPHRPYTYKPSASVARVRDENRRAGHTSGVTHVDFHPFNRDVFLTSSFDHTLKQWSCKTASVSAHFDLQAKIYSHATSPIVSSNSSVVVACATQHSNVRLVDLRSRSTAQSLPATGNGVLAVAWSPRHERVLASGHADGRVRVWDARRAHGPIGVLDMEDSLGVVHRFNHAMASGMGWNRTPAVRSAARAHSEAVNGLSWTDDGKYIVSAGLDWRIRVWNAATGANTLAGFGSAVRNRQAASVRMIVSPSSLTAGYRELLFWPNEHEILVLDLHDGHVLSRLRVPGFAPGSNLAGPLAKTRITGMAWRGSGGRRKVLGLEMGGGNAPGGIYTSHADGHVRAWMPHIEHKDEPGTEGDGHDDDDEETRKRKRKVVDDAYRSLMGKQITFT